MIENGHQQKSQICSLIIELIRHHNGKIFQHFLTQKFPKKYRILETRNANPKETTTAKRLLFARDTS